MGLEQITADDIRALAEWEALRQQLASHVMPQEKLLVARLFGMTWEQVNLPWQEWMALWNRFKNEVGVVRTRDGPRAVTEEDVAAYDAAEKEVMG